ncbi:MAG: flagellar hook-length control protein FliK [Pseudomonadota bacterium]
MARGSDAHAPLEDPSGGQSEAGPERAALSFGERLGEVEKSIGAPLAGRPALAESPPAPTPKEKGSRPDTALTLGIQPGQGTEITASPELSLQGRTRDGGAAKSPERQPEWSSQEAPDASLRRSADALTPGEATVQEPKLGSGGAEATSAPVAAQTQREAEPQFAPALLQDPPPAETADTAPHKTAEGHEPTAGAETETAARPDKNAATVNTAAPLAGEKASAAASVGDQPPQKLKILAKGQSKEPAKALPGSPETPVHDPRDAKATTTAAANDEASPAIAPENAFAPPAPLAAAIIPQPASDNAAHGAAPELAPEGTTLAAEADAPAPRPTPAMVGTDDVKTSASPEPPVAQTGQKTAEPIDMDTRVPTGGSEPTPPPAPLAPVTGPSPSTPATQAPAAPLPLNMAAPAWPQALADYISQPRLGDNDTLTLTLTPERMGALQIRISVEDGRTDIQIVAETTEAMATLRDAQHRLADAFSRAGLELGSQSLQLDHPGGQSGAQGGGAQGWGAAHHTSADEGGQYATNDGETGPLAPASSAPDRARLAPGQSIDLLA